jgi:hypothetical protein
MVEFTADDDLVGARIVEADMTGATISFTNLSGARIEQSYLPESVLRGVDLTDAEVDGMIDGLVLNGVEIEPLVDAALNERFPGRAGRRSTDPAEQLAAYDAAQARWAEVIERLTANPELRDAHVDGEWSVSQTLRHLVFATDGWLRYAVLGLPEPFHPFGQVFTEMTPWAAALGVDAAATPSWDDVLAARADRVAQVRDYLRAQTAQTFAGKPHRLPPWDDDAPQEQSGEMTIARCMGEIGNQAWEQRRIA